MYDKGRKIDERVNSSGKASIAQRTLFNGFLCDLNCFNFVDVHSIQPVSQNVSTCQSYNG